MSSMTTVSASSGVGHAWRLFIGCRLRGSTFRRANGVAFHMQLRTSSGTITALPVLCRSVTWRTRS